MRLIIPDSQAAWEATNSINKDSDDESVTLTETSGGFDDQLLALNPTQRRLGDD